MLRRATLALLLFTLFACNKPSVTAKPTNLLLFAGGMANAVHCAYVAPSFFESTPAKPFLGRLFLPQEYFSNPPAVILSYPAWQQRFQSAPNKGIGSGVDLAGLVYTIVGVMPASFDTANHAEFLIANTALAK